MTRKLTHTNTHPQNMTMKCPIYFQNIIIFVSLTDQPIPVTVRSKAWLACWDCGFETRRRHGCLSVVIVVCCQVEVSASG